MDDLLRLFMTESLLSSLATSLTSSQVRIPCLQSPAYQTAWTALNPDVA